MKVKIGDAYYDSAEIPVMVVLDDFDKSKLVQMLQSNPEFNKYMAYRKSHFEDDKQAQAWMDDEFKFMKG